MGTEHRGLSRIASLADALDTTDPALADALRRQAGTEFDAELLRIVASARPLALSSRDGNLVLEGVDDDGGWQVVIAEPVGDDPVYGEGPIVALHQ